MTDEELDELRFYRAHQMVALERIYDLLLFIAANQAGNDNQSKEFMDRILEQHQQHTYRWPE